jgi:hypothetical protein
MLYFNGTAISRKLPYMFYMHSLSGNLNTLRTLMELEYKLKLYPYKDLYRKDDRIGKDNTFLPSQEENFHGKILLDYRKREEFVIFMVSRNPYTRILSSFLSLIAGQDIHNPVHINKRLFYKLTNINPEKEINFEQFIDIIDSNELANSRSLDKHMSSAYCRLNSDDNSVPLNYLQNEFDLIIRMEDWDNQIFKALDMIVNKANINYDVRNVPIHNKKKHESNDNGAQQLKTITNSTNEYLKECYNAKIAEKVYRMYENDFNLFGYKECFDDATEILPPIENISGAKTTLFETLRKILYKRYA